ncbi:MAG TPA: TetR family transcriptional regulator [Acetobacteraceae bacterium]|nr:TetR family transcriptional regulator [Acetobacteraceae bacterium]
MRQRILAAAVQEFSRNGYSGARIDRIAAAAGANKRMLYYHVGNKEVLYLTVLEGAYAQIREAEHALELQMLAPPDAIGRLVEFTWAYYLAHPEFMALLNEENLHAARHLRKSGRVKTMHSPFVQMIEQILRRGVESGVFRPGVDAVQLYISIAGLAYFYLSNQATLSTIFGRDLLAKPAKAARLAHMTDLVLAALRP